MTFATTFRKGDRVSRIDSPSTRGSFVRYNLDGETSIIDWDGWGHSTTPTELLRHAPVNMVGPALLDPPTRCPECGSELTIDPDAERLTSRGNDHPLRTKVRVAACSGCEWIIELPRGVYR